jgi:hypothetical protein
MKIRTRVHTLQENLDCLDTKHPGNKGFPAKISSEITASRIIPLDIGSYPPITPAIFEL